MTVARLAFSGLGVVALAVCPSLFGCGSDDDGGTSSGNDSGGAGGTSPSTGGLGGTGGTDTTSASVGGSAGSPADAGGAGGSGGTSDGSGGSSTETTTSSSEGSGGSATSTTGSAGAPPEPGVYFAEEFVETGDVQSAYIDLKGADETSDLGTFHPAQTGIELAGAGLAVIPLESEDELDAIYVASGLAPEITRYEIDDDGQLSEGGTVSFSGVGLTGVSGYDVVVVNENKGYVLDNAGLRAIAWDPTAMELTGEEIDLSIAVKADYTAQARGFFARASDGRVFIPYVWNDVDDATLRTSAALIIDSETDEVINLAEDDRCPGISMVPLPNGDMHFFVPSGWAQQFYLDVEPPRDPLCSLRILAGEDEFDPDYSLNLTELVGGDENGGGGVQGGIPDGAGGIYIGVADEVRYQYPEDYSFLFYRLWHLDVEEETATEVPNTPWWGGAMTRNYMFNGYAYAVQPFGASATTTVFEMREKVSWFTMSGWIEPFVRVR